MDQDQDSWAKEYATVFLAEMMKRFPPTEIKDPKKAVFLEQVWLSMSMHSSSILTSEATSSRK